MEKGKVVVMNSRDNVATAIQDLEEQQKVAINDTLYVDVLQSIPFGHKIAIDDIQGGTPVIKYGETIGIAIHDIKKGEHVHVHNTDGCRGRGDSKEVKNG